MIACWGSGRPVGRAQLVAPTNFPPKTTISVLGSKKRTPRRRSAEVQENEEIRDETDETDEKDGGLNGHDIEKRGVKEGQTLTIFVLRCFRLFFELTC